MPEQLERILAQWRAEKPHLDVSPMAVIGRLGRASAAVDARLGATFAEHDMDASTFDVLATLLRSGPPYSLAPGALSRDAMISSSAVAQRLNKLETRGLLTRAANPDDGRGTLVTLTAAGHTLIEASLPDHLATEHAIIGSLTKSEQAQLAALLQLLEEGACATTQRGVSERAPQHNVE
ncbi:MarR family winged helix-turn-helix transcriptional regulator [Arthrobacter antibioticus]|uniref:MarR family winged helix-turn-helix transcriptional regulator n=1 Tax=Arthrobacter sp. H35-MC1 TaxID=3046203 RepID=UPI0024BAA551|nr:MarR family transcriptional regulator [Arthrobacter sp. H35-MC1]MDJ0316404.1 MarR family transcriptional regulator [Arthrobacter sp. H35-MC1]